MYWRNSQNICALIAPFVLMCLVTSFGYAGAIAPFCPSAFLGPRPGVTYVFSDLGWRQIELTGKKRDIDGVLHVESKTTYKEVKDAEGNPQPNILMTDHIIFSSQNGTIMMQEKSGPAIPILKLGAHNWSHNSETTYWAQSSRGVMTRATEEIVIHCELRSKSTRMLFGKERRVLATSCRIPVAGKDGETSTHYYELAEGLGIVKRVVYSSWSKSVESEEAVIEIKPAP